MNAQKKPTPPAATTTPKRNVEPRLYKARDRVTGDVTYVNANNRSQAENFTSFNRFEITILTVREALGVKAEEVLDATVQPWTHNTKSKQDGDTQAP